MEKNTPERVYCVVLCSLDIFLVFESWHHFNSFWKIQWQFRRNTYQLIDAIILFLSMTCIFQRHHFSFALLGPGTSRHGIGGCFEYTKGLGGTFEMTGE